MQSETLIGEHELRQQENDPSPRRRSDNFKLPPIPHPKSPEINYSKKNKQMIKELKEKKKKQQELMEKSRKKEEEEREKLRQLILEEAARVREQKKLKESQQEVNQSVEIEKPIRGRDKVDEKKDDEETEKEKEDKAKLYHYYRSRHVLFLKSLKENLDSKKEQEEHIKKKKEDKINKIRESMGINNISSKFYQFDKSRDKQDGDEETKVENLAVKKSHSVRDKERPHSSEAQPLSAEVQKALLEKQKKIIADIYEKKKKTTALAEEEKHKQISKQREKLKEKVLGMMKKGEDGAGESTEDLSSPGLGAYSKGVSANLNGLDLESNFTKKEKKKRKDLSLPPIRDKQDKDDDDDDKIYGGLEKIPESTKAIKKKKSKKQLPTYLNVTDMATWKKRHRLEPETKVYIVNGGYGDIKAALDKRGWVENPDQNSPCFDLKWTLRAKDIDHGALIDGQIVNHFEKNTTITTKVGLCKSLRNLIWFDNVDIDTFYPRCFDLSDVHDYEEFLEEFKGVKAESILKQYVKACKNNDPKAKDMEIRVQVAARICENRLIDLDELLEDQAEIAHILVSPEEWEILSNDELSQKDLALKKHAAWLAKNEINGPKCASQKEEKKSKKKKKKAKANKADKLEKEEGEGENEEEVENELLDKVEGILEEAKNKCPQFGINGEKNIWIVKPAGLSRGRGISCFRNLVEIQDYVKGKESQWIAQKYMENPLIVHRRKFDIRQWILVCDWNPLTIWYYEECYIRFSAEEYDTENLDNKFVHLTNNSIGKYHENQNCPTFEQNMWKMETFSKYLEEQFGSNVFEEKIKPQMKQIVIWALECVQDMVENRKNSMEFYGVDFMIDEDLRVWLIEINSSPDMEYSTPVTKRLVKAVSDDIVKVVVDYNINTEKKKKKEIDTGLFTLIHKSKRFVEKPLNSFGLDLVLEGKKISK